MNITADPVAILGADRVVLPGVGAIRDCMGELNRLHLASVAREVAAAAKPFLGICLGMQLMLDHSEENGGVDCLGLIHGGARHFAQHDETIGLKIPHMGWNTVHQQSQHPLWTGIDQEAHFYLSLIHI